MDQQRNFDEYGYMFPFSEIATKRYLTDKAMFVVMGIFIVSLGGFLGYCISAGDIYRIVNGYDDCGNVCGRFNGKWTDYDSGCFSEDMTNKKFLLIRNGAKTCVENCGKEGGHINYLNRCNGIGNEAFDFFVKISEDVQICWLQLFYMSLVALVFSVMILMCLRYATKLIVWASLIAFAALCIGVSIYAWILFVENKSTSNNDSYYGYLSLAITLTIITVVLLLVILVMIRKVNFVIRIFKEAATAIAGVPFVLFQPVLTFFSLVLAYFLFIYFTMWIASAGFRKTIVPGKIVFEQNSIITFTYVYNLFAIFWITQFIIGCQHIIVSGCISFWFFTRDKTKLNRPYITSVTNLLKYHLATVGLASLIIAIIQIIRACVHALRQAARTKRNVLLAIIGCCLNCCFAWLEEIFKFFTRNSYIMTAIHGLPFWKAGKRALNLIVHNIFKVAAINSIGDYVLTLLKLVPVIIVASVGYEILKDNSELHYVGVMVFLLVIFSYLIGHCFLTVFELATDTILLCFCEDCEVNDGLSKPYYMSQNLMKFVKKYGQKRINS